MSTKAPMTIDDLAVIVQKGFYQVDKRFDQVDKRFSQVDKRFENIEDRLVKLEVKIENLDGDIIKLYRSVMKLEYQVRDNTEEVTKLKDLSNKIVINIDKAAKNNETDEVERAALQSQVDRLDRWVHLLAAKEGIKLEA